ncbi:MAG: hypothetical protein ACI9WU_002559 [Myxococcota bacterium]|jgi:hypothetical protein
MWIRHLAVRLPEFSVRLPAMRRLQPLVLPAIGCCALADCPGPPAAVGFGIASLSCRPPPPS